MRWQTELLYREVENGERQHPEEHHDEEHEHIHVEEAGDDHDGLPGGSEWEVYSQVIYTMNLHVDAGVRLVYVAGDSDLETGDRFRASPAVTVYFDSHRRSMLRAQYNYDDIDGGGEVR